MNPGATGLTVLALAGTLHASADGALEDGVDRDDAAAGPLRADLGEALARELPARPRGR